MNINIVAKYTFKDIFRSKVMINNIFIAIVLFVMTFVAKEFTYGSPSKISLDFGLGILSISSKMIALLFGLTLISSEIESRTIYMALSRPISRGHFLIGKLLGLNLILVVNIFILASMCLLTFVLNDGQFHSMIIGAVINTLIESSIMMCLVVFFTLITDRVLAFIYTIGIYFSSYAIDLVQNSNYVNDRDFLNVFMKFIRIIIPNFNLLDLRKEVIYIENFDITYFFKSSLYGIAYLIVLISLSVMIFNKKSLD